MHDASKKKSETAQLAAVRADELLPLKVVEKRLGIGRAALRKLFRDGLPRRQIGKRAVILGADLIDFIGQQTPDTEVA